MSFPHDPNEWPSPMQIMHSMAYLMETMHDYSFAYKLNPEDAWDSWINPVPTRSPAPIMSQPIAANDNDKFRIV